MDVTDEELKPLYQWIDEIPLSRPKRNIARDFADGGALHTPPQPPLGSASLVFFRMFPFL